MSRSLRAFVAAVLVLGCPACGADKSRPAAVAPADAAGRVDVGDALYAPPAQALPALQRSRFSADPIVIPDCRLAVIDKQEVPCQREGVLLFIGTEIPPDQEVPRERQVEVRTPNGVKRFQRLQEDDLVAAGQLLAQLDDRLTADELAIRNGRLTASKADLAAAEKTRDEAKNRFDTQTRLLQSRSTTPEEARASKLTWERHCFDVISKEEAVKLAELERNQAQTVLAMYEIRSAIPGVVKTIYKKRGEALRAMEPVLQIHDLSRLRVEGLVDVEQLPHLKKGVTAFVEPANSVAPEQTLLGHLQEVTAVAVSQRKGKTLVLSASEDHTVRVWERSTRQEQRVLPHPGPVRCLACPPPAADVPWCVTGAADGVARLWDLDQTGDQPVRQFAAHQGPVSCVAFSPDGKFCVTGGDDREMHLWDVATGQRCYQFPTGHRAALTAVQFTPDARLVSAGRDNTLLVWKLGTLGALLEKTIDRRSGDVPCPGVSPDGRHLLLDQGKALRLLSLRDGVTDCVLQNGADGSQFTTFALFSPDARRIVTAGAGDGRVQLWRAATEHSRPHEICQLVAPERAPATCAAFAPDGSFLVTGTKDRQVLVWVPPAAGDRPLTAVVTRVEPAVESSARQLRVWAEIANPDGALLPGGSATLTIYRR